MINEIGERAGRMWQFMTELLVATPKGISEALRFDDALLCLAMGWLARDGERK